MIRCHEHPTIMLPPKCAFGCLGAMNATYPRTENDLLAPYGHRQASIAHSLSDDKPLLERDAVEPQVCCLMG